MKLTIAQVFRTVALGLLVLTIALVATSPGAAQGSDVKPIRLVTGEIVPDIVRPSDVKVAPGALFDGRYFKLIQLAQIPGEAERRDWEAAGLRLVDYLPDNTYFAVINRDFDLNRLAGRAVTIIDVADVFRLEPRLITLRAEGQPVDKLVVSYYATLDAEKVMADLQARGVTIAAHRDYSRQLDIAIDPARLAEIIARPYLQFLGPEPEEPVLEGYDHRNASGRSNYLNTGYNGLNYNGAGVVVGIGEGGTVDNLTDVKGRLTEMEVGSPSDHKIGVMQCSGGAGNLDPTDRNNAWGASFLSIASSPNYAALYASHTLRYTNHSYGAGTTPSGGYDSTARDHDLRIAAYPNHLVVYSSGNSGEQTGYAPYNFPTWATITGAMKMNKNMFAVGALSPADVLTSFSSRGPMLDGRIIPQLVIEGIEGTSDAAPKVTGEVAQLAQVYKTKNGGAEPPSSLLRAIMLNTADDLGNAGPDFKHGYGRVNLRRAYNVIDNVRFLTGSVSNGNTNQHTIAVPANTKQVRVLIVWPDVAAAVNANPAIVNNLNLVVKDPANTPYNPWVLDSSTPSSEAKLDTPAVRGVDSLNTIEQVTVDDPASGNWTVEVSGANVPSGPQTYYLTYEFLMDELQMMFPLKDHRFISGAAYHLKWDSYGSSGTFTLAYQLDGGAWTNIVTGYDAASRTYQWTAPAMSGIHTIKFRVQRGALTSESDVNYIGQTPDAFYLHWACADAVRLAWNAVPGATSYKVYRLGAQYMEEVASNITFDGASAILTGQSTGVEYYAVSALTGSNEGQRTMAVTKAAGDTGCFNVKTGVTRSVDKTDVTVRGSVNPHNAALTDVHFEYGPTTSYGSTTPNIPISAVGHVEETVSSAIAVALSSRSDVLHYRLVATKDGATTVYGEDREIRLAPGNDFTFDGVDDFIDVSDHLALPIYRSGAGTGYAITFWVKGNPQAGKEIYSEASSTDGDPWLTIRTADITTGKVWIIIRDDNGNYLRNAYSSASGIVLDNTWHHVAFVDANGSAKLYIDGNQDQAFTYTPGLMTLDRASIGARLTSSASNFFTGRVDEVGVWDKALTAAEVRDLLHQPRQGDEAGLKAYYHLDDVSSRVFDVVSEREATIGGGGTKTTSAAPFGVGATFTASEAAGSVAFTGTGLAIYYNSQAGGTVTGSRIDLPPNTVSGVSGSAIFDSQYWVIHRYGTGSFNANVTFTVSEVLTAQDEAQPSRIKLYSRALGSDGAWSLETYAGAVNAAAKQVTFNGVTAFNKQYIVARLDDAKSWDGSESTDWFNPDNWTPAVVPTAADDVLIASTAPNQPAINAAGAVCRNISIETGASLTMSGATAYTLSVAGDWVNNGTFTRGIGTVEFSGTNSYQQIAGASTTNFNILRVAKGAQDRILEATSLITLNAPTNPLDMTSGTFKLSSASTITPFTSSAGAELFSTDGIWNNGGTINYGNFQWYNAGLLKLTSGTINSGTTADNHLIYFNGGKIVIEGGALNIAAALRPNSGTSSGSYTQAGGIVTVNTAGSTATDRAVFELNSGVPFSMSGGTIVVQKASSHTTAEVIISSTTNAVSGGTLQIGNSSTLASQTIRINSTAPIYNLVVNATNSPTAQLVTNPLTVKNDVTISGGALNANGQTMYVGGNWTNNGAFTHGNGAVRFNGSGGQAIGGASISSFFDIFLESTSNVTGPAGGTVNVARNWTNDGTFNHNNGAVRFNGSGAQAIGGSAISSFFDIFLESTSSVTGPAGGTINVARNWTNNGTFNHNNGAVRFNGSGAQAIGGSAISSFFDVFLESASSVTGPAGNMNVAGNWTNNGTFNHNNGTVTFNGAASQTAGGASAATFHNLTVNNTGTGVSLGQNQTVNRLLTLTNGDVDLGGNTLTLATTTAGNGVTATGARTITGNGTVAFTAARTISGGTLAFGPNVTVRITDGVDFGAGGLSTVNGMLLINGGGYVQSGKAPKYGGSSTLKYDTGGSYGAYEEWYPNTTSGPGVPQNVEIASGTALNFGSSGYARTARGHVTINGTLALSTAGGGDLNLGGNWINNGTFSNNGRAVAFNGSGVQTIGGSADTTFAYLTIDNAAGVSLGRPALVNNQLTLTNGLLTLGSHDLTLGSSASAISGAFGDARMIVADGAGALCKQFAGNSSFDYPIGDATGTVEYSPSTLNFTAGTFDSGARACVRVVDAAHPNGDQTNYPTYISRYWPVTQSGISGFNCTATFTYVEGDEVIGSGQTVAALHHWSYNGSTWTMHNPVNTATNTLSSAVSSFSDHTARSSTPLAVTLAAFTAETASNGVTLAWETVSELNNAGFNVYRAESEIGPWSKLNDALILAVAPGSSIGHVYTWEDALASPNTAYFYRLESVDLAGAAETLGITGVTYRPAQRSWLPLVR